MNKFKFPLLVLVMLGSVLLLSGCDNLILFHPKGLIAAKEINLIVIATLLMLIVVIPVIFLTIVIAWRYRASNKKATYTPEWDHSVKLEALWWAIPCIIILILAVITWITSHTLDPYKPLDSKVKPVRIQAIALEWRWLFIYPDQGIATINYVQIPEKTPINFSVTSDAPMNSLWIPQLAGQIYAMTGMNTQLHLIADTEGTYDGLSANYSGAGFTGMKFKVKSTSRKDFDKWVSSVKQSSSAADLTWKAYGLLDQPTEDQGVYYFSSVKPGLYKDVINKFMMPAKHNENHS